MENLTKRDIVVRLSNETGMTQAEVQNIVQRLLDHMTEALASGQEIELRNFGVLAVKLRKARIGRNPNKPDIDVPIPPRAVVKFKAGKEMKARVQMLSEQLAGSDPRPSSTS